MTTFPLIVSIESIELHCIVQWEALHSAHIRHFEFDGFHLIYKKRKPRQFSNKLLILFVHIVHMVFIQQLISKTASKVYLKFKCELHKCTYYILCGCVGWFLLAGHDIICNKTNKFQSILAEMSIAESANQIKSNHTDWIEQTQFNHWKWANAIAVTYHYHGLGVASLADVCSWT